LTTTTISYNISGIESDILIVFAKKIFMRILNKIKFIKLLPIILVSLLFISASKIYAATSRIDLLTADDFAILGGSTITNTGSSVITGDLGLHPGTSLTGFPPGTINGTTHATDAVALQAQTDLTTAYNDAASRSCTANLSGQDLGGMTLTPGVYCFDSSAQLTGTLILNGEGDADAVFIFKMGSTITTASGSSVSLINSAQSCNVFWQVVSSATLGTTTSFIGNIMALTSITLNTSATVNGRVLARNGAVTLDTNAISKATCAVGTAGAPTPTPTPTPTSTSSSTTSSNSVDSYCAPIANTVVTPIIIESKRVDKDSIYIKWGPYSGVDTFNVEYGFENGKFLYNTNVTGFYVTINDLPLNQPIWIRVAARNDCQIGTYGQPLFVGGPSMPNTGFIVNKKNIFELVLSFFENLF